MKQYFIIFLFFFTSISKLTYCSIIQFLNNSNTHIFITNNFGTAIYLQPYQHHTFHNNSPIILSLYQSYQSNSQQFQLTFRIKELTTSQHNIGISTLDLEENLLESKFPGRFELLSQDILLIQQKQEQQLNTMQAQFKETRSVAMKNSQQSNNKNTSSTNKMKSTTATNKENTSSSTKKNNSISSEPSQKTVDALISQFNSLQKEKEIFDSSSLRPKRTPNRSEKNKKS